MPLSAKIFFTRRSAGMFFLAGLLMSCAGPAKSSQVNIFKKEFPDQLQKIQTKNKTLQFVWAGEAR